MKINSILMAAALLWMGFSEARGGIILYGNLSESSPDADRYPVNRTFWAGQQFNSGVANELTGLTMNLFTLSPGSGSYLVNLYFADGAGGTPGTFVATLENNQSVSALTQFHDGQVTFSGLSQPINPNTSYYIVLGGQSGLSGQDHFVQWGFSETMTGTGLGVRSFSDSPDGGNIWNTVNTVAQWP